MPNLYRTEFPRPDFKREQWMCLNGKWEFQFDWKESWTIEEGLHKKYEDVIQVPFCYQSKLSGIENEKDCHVVWYKRKVSLQKGDRTILLKFGAVDYKARVWVNGTFIGIHEGGHTSFSMDVTDAVRDGENVIVVKAEDYQNADKPRGKQTWTGRRFGCWYTPTTGIWQSVWLEFVPKVHLKRVKITPDLNSLTAICELFISSYSLTECTVYPHTMIDGQDYDFGKLQLFCRNGYGKAVIAFQDFDLRREAIYWKPEHPNLIDVDITVRSDFGEDKVTTYFGMRSISAEKGKVFVNQEEYFQRLVLDQGYWKDSLLTPPSEEAIIEDIKLVKEMGFNGVRKHQKIEDPLFYYHADRMGLLVWGELPSSYEFNDNMIKRSTEELIHFVERDFNHPSIVVWVPVNESWGVRDIYENISQQSYVRAMACLLNAMDGTRLVDSNDGWEQVDCTDICGIHDYIYTQKSLGKYDDMQAILNGTIESRMIFARGYEYRGQPVMLTEYGGIAFDNGKDGTWGYLNKAKNEDEFLERLTLVTEEMIKSRKFAGFCYTQLTDIMQEANGLLTIEREPKISTKKLNTVFGMKFYE
ncbi:glycoside hydrolase family 2 protein [Muricomes intestini]|uniref:glycoside hydrolase family 2 protein n=1 Tax=Muricomes intestini TaxID=1796634 RepID=UPI002FDF159B